MRIAPRRRLPRSARLLPPGPALPCSGSPPAPSPGGGSNYLSARLTGRTLEEAHADILMELDHQRAELDTLTRRLADVVAPQ